MWRLHLCNRHFFWQQEFLKNYKLGLGGFSCHHALAHHFLNFNGPVCCPQCPILIFWAVAALFVKHVFCCWGHHILKKSKWWGMPVLAGSLDPARILYRIRAVFAIFGRISVATRILFDQDPGGCHFFARILIKQDPSCN